MSDYIPPELILNILARLPVVDVLRCTSVCKSWYSLITSPSFASSHLNLSSPNQEPRLLVRYFKSEDREISFCMHRDSQTFDEIAELDSPFHRQWIVIDSVSGLVCMYHLWEDTIALWNPYLRKSFTVPNPRVLSNSRVAKHVPDVGFGFIASSNDYKILWISYAYTEPQVKIYQLSSGSWRDLEAEVYSYINHEDCSQQAHLNGVVHWYTRNLKKVNPSFSNLICSFDMKTEKFGALMVPSCLRHEKYESFMTSTFRESLCLIDLSDEFGNIWVMKEYGVADSWQNLFNFSKEQHDLRSFGHFRDNGELLFAKSYNGKSELVSYDSNNNQVKNLGVLGFYEFWIYNCMDSLAFIKCPDEVKIDED